MPDKDKISEILDNILAAFMEDIEEVGSEIVGSPTPQDLKAVDDVYSEAKAKITQLLLEELQQVKVRCRITSGEIYYVDDRIAELKAALKEQEGTKQ